MTVKTVAACVLAVLLAALAGCAGAPGLEAAADPAPPADYLQPLTTDWEGDSLIAQNHVAADGMVANLANRLPKGAGILAATFVNRDNFDESSSLGRLLSAQVVTRLAQAGFGVMEVRLRAEMGVRVREGEFVLSRKTAQYARNSFDAAAVLVGGYTVDRETVFVSARVALLETGRVLAAYDFAVPRRGAVKRLLDDGQDVAFDSYLRSRVVKPVAQASPDAFSPLLPEEIPLGTPGGAAGAAVPGQVPGPVEVPGPFRLFPPTSVQ